MKRVIIGCTGVARSGKDSVGSILVNKYGFKRVSFADPVYEALHRLNPTICCDPAGIRTLSSAVSSWGWEGVKDSFPEVRGLLQRMGTEVGRELFGSDFWVTQALSKLDGASNYVFTDVRFDNEAEAVIGTLGGSVWKIERPGYEPVNSHSSDKGINPEHIRFELSNSGTLEELKNTVGDVLRNYDIPPSTVGMS